VATRSQPKLLAQAEAALDTEQAMPAGADVRASRTIRMLGDEYLRDSIERGKQPRTMEQRESRGPRPHPADHRRGAVTKWRVEHSRRVMEKGSKTLFSQRAPQGPPRATRGNAEACVASAGHQRAEG
jgi:hypothetical protein